MGTNLTLTKNSTLVKIYLVKSILLWLVPLIAGCIHKINNKEMRPMPDKDVTFKINF